MSQAEIETTDTKAIEEKALNYFKSFIEDSKIISQYLDEDDKEPCWDGHLYIYSDGKRDKGHLQGRVPIQIKGTQVERFVTKKWKYILEKVDLKAYLHEPTFFIVCQVKKDSKERKLFYRELLPDLVNKLLRDMGEKETRKTLFHPMTDDLNEFEDQLKIFMGNSQRMVSFANSNPLTMADAVKKGIKEFSFIAPSRFTGLQQLLKYLSTHSTYLYAKVSKDLNIEMPLADGPARFQFKRQDNGDVKVGDKVYFKGYTTEVRDGRFIITIADIITIDMPMDADDKIKPTVKMTTKAKYLKNAINEAEFALALNDTGVLSIGDVDIQLVVNEEEYVKDLRNRLERWKYVDNVLEKLHVTKPFDLSIVTEKQSKLIDLLIETIGKGNTIKIPGQQSTILTMEIGNINLLLWCAAAQDGTCALGDFFDKTIRIAYKINDEENVNVSPFSYLQNEHFWEKIDNIDYSSLIESAQEAANGHSFCYEMSNYDVLAMISAAYTLTESDNERSNMLLSEAFRLNEWLIANDPNQEMMKVHRINQMQILKRQRDLSNDEIKELNSVMGIDGLDDSIKVAVLLLLDRKKEAKVIYDQLPENEKVRLENFPIWKFYKE